MTKEWRVVTEAPEYQVSSDGEIKSIYTNRPLKGGIDKDGYRRLVLCTKDKRIYRRVATLVCEAFHGNRPDNKEVRHLDGSRSNNSADNLTWSTHQENITDKIKHGTTLRGERSPRAKLTVNDVREIRASSETISKLSKRFKVSTYAVWCVRSRKTWKYS